jgi:hypothetical protein
MGEQAADTASNTVRADTGSDSAAEISFDTLVKDLGTIREGERIIAYYDYSNTGDAPLIITGIKAGCGCTVPEWKKDPLAPGDSENFKVVFDSRGKSGLQDIRITVRSNAINSALDLRLKSSVETN